MKCFLIVLFSLFALNCSKNNEDSLDKIDLIVDNSKVWYISESPNSCPTCIWPHKIVLGKDTSINSFIYKTILDYCGDSQENNCEARIRGYIRETLDKKVYWYAKHYDNVASDVLIYDFNARINDTIDKWIVKKIDTVTIYNTDRKRITLVNCESNENYWIDGIGNMADILSYHSRTICDYETGMVVNNVGGSRFKLNCVKQGEEFIYKDPLDTDCWIYKGY